MNYKSHYYQKTGNTKLKHDLVLRIVKLILATLITIPFIICWYEYYEKIITYPFYNKGNLLMIFLYFILFTILGRIYECFYISIHKKGEMIYSIALTAFMVNAIEYMVIALLFKSFPSVMPLLAMWGAQIIIALIWANGAQTWYYSVFPARRTIVIHDQENGMHNLIKQYDLEKKYKVIKNYSIQECFAENMSSLEQADVVFLQDIHSHDRNVILKYCIEHGIRVYVLPRIGDVIMSGAVKQHLFHLPVLSVSRYAPSPIYLFVKRFFDIVLSLVAIIIFSPFMLGTAIAIKKEDGGSILFRQRRLTKNGKEFDVLKFRSMREDAEKDGVARLSTGDSDDRITKVGRFIRKVRLDELPQLFNILKGDMTIVGPRPERPELAKEYEATVPDFSLRLQAKAGLTGYAQIYGKYNTTPYYKLQMDLMYLSEPSLFKDLGLIFATIKILFMKESTEGVEE